MHIAPLRRGIMHIALNNVERHQQLWFENLRGITSITQLSGSNSKVYNFGIRDNVSIILCAVKLINAQ